MAILLVLFAHVGLGRLVPGAFGVTLFFFISGYLITRQLAVSLARTGQIGFFRFYARRALRLLPAAAVYIAVSGALYDAAGGRIGAAGWLAALFYGANYFDLFVGFRSTLPLVRHPFNILWSLAIEEQFYAVWPVALAALWRVRAALLVVAGVCVLALMWRFWLLDACFAPGAPLVCGPPNPNPEWRFNRLYLATDARLDSLGWGAVLALLPRMPSRWLAWPGVALLALSFVGVGPLARDVVRPTLQGVALLGVFPVLLHNRVLAAPACVFIGKLSYSLYLWHWAALMVADVCARRYGLAWVAIAVTLTVLCAIASYYCVERPTLSLRRRFGSRAP